MSPWVRLDENSLEHPKIAGLSDGAFRLWVQGLAHCQKFLTDGFMADAAVRAFRAYSPKRRDSLVDAELWALSESGYRVHDFLDWNESREHVMSARKSARERMSKLRGSSREHTPNVRDRTNTTHVTPRNVTPQEGSTNPPAAGPETDARSKRPVFCGQRLTVFEWMVDDLRRMLGPQTESFDLHAWFFALDARAVGEDVVIPPRDGGAWLQQQTLAEAKRRGLVVADGKPTLPTVAALAEGARRILEQEERDVIAGKRHAVR